MYLKYIFVVRKSPAKFLYIQDKYFFLSFFVDISPLPVFDYRFGISLLYLHKKKHKNLIA